MLKQYQIRTTDSFFCSRGQDLCPESKQRGATPERKGDTIANDIAYSKVLYRMSSTGIGRTISKDILSTTNSGMELEQELVEL